MHSAVVEAAQHILLNILFIFIVATIAGALAEKINIPDVAVFLIAGMLIGPSAFGIVNIPSNSILNEGILLIGAAFILYHGGTITHLNVLKQVWISVTLLATLGVVITAAVVGFAANVLFHIPLMIAFLLGAILASTDPAALVPIFYKYPIRNKVAQTVITESAFTDATGAILTTMIIGMLIRSSSISGDIFLQFLQLSLGGIIIGAVIGFITTFLISNHRLAVFQGFVPTMITIAVFASFLVAEKLHTSGFMSVFVAGLIFANADVFRISTEVEVEQKAHAFLETVSLKMRMLIFVLLGSQIQFHVLAKYGWIALAIAMIFIFIARPLTVLASLLPDRRAKWQKNEWLFFFWTRETGVIPAALVGMIGGMGIQYMDFLVASTFVAILSTILLQASTTPWVAKKLGLLDLSTRKQKWSTVVNENNELDE
ncbi:sodium/proton antiporter, CPA1 family [Seinonella peptonophila]|uniref:Sodium/proton antiporter, CPA1 family n=1 Tax=Seinonella peptonophila TaxID=112248 RepID=A0A1M4Y3Z2_9BACL|nr:sodium:proton antiporter [Seinonella peptonophila]SHF00471.1 sodium/proton antiporter, CPA1 family [Seinonella peptonophila]